MGGKKGDEEGEVGEARKGGRWRGEQGGLYWLYCVIVFRSHEWDESGVWPLGLSKS